MADEPKADKKVESAETQQESMPDSDKTPSDSDVASPQGEGKAEQDAKLPEGVKERTTEQFDKLKKQLREEKEKRLRLERVSQQINQTQIQTAPQKVDYYNPETGEVDVGKLDNRIVNAEQGAARAEQQARRIIEENDQKQERVAYKAHPDLDPTRDEFNEDYQKAVVGYLANVYAEGKNMTLKQAADKVKGFSKGDLKKAEEQGATKAREQLTDKEQAAMEATGRSDRRQKVTNLADLQQRTREGDKSAVLERLKNIPIVGK